MTRGSPTRGAPRTISPLVILWMFAVVILGLLILANFSFGLLSSARAYVGAESSWSKAQKDAVFDLQKYGVSRAPEDLSRFRAAIAVPLGDRDARIEMDKPNPDFEKIRQGFIRGHVHPDDIDGMIELYRRFRWISFMQQAIRAWDAGDRYIVQLDSASTQLQLEIESVSPSAGKIQAILAEILAINANLTPIENQFVDALGDASRTTYRSLRGFMLAVTPGLLLLAIVLSLRILRQRKRAQDRINHIAFHDDLTSLPNRLMFGQQLDRALSWHRRAGTQLAVLFLDLNRFKLINDSLGREVGDVLLPRCRPAADSVTGVLPLSAAPGGGGGGRSGAQSAGRRGSFYAEARDKFLTAARGAGAASTRYPLNQRGPDNGDLSADVAFVGPSD